MASTSAYINGTALDEFNNVWAVGRDLTKFDGSSWTYYDSTNSVVPGNIPYYLDTRSISISPDSTKWVGCAYSPSLPTPLIFSAAGPYAATGFSWTAAEITGSGSQALDVPTIYASPFGDEILAFISPLNGGAGTGPAGVFGVTGGSLYTYSTVLKTWFENAPDFSWPHIYDIKAKGIDGYRFNYYLATQYGIYVIPDGDLSVSSLEGGEPYIENSQIWNSKNTSLPSDIIYSIDFDENGNLWIGTSAGLVYWDQKKFYVWDNTTLANLGSNEIRFVQSRSNGHVFFSAGNPLNSQGTGLYLFNGDTLTVYNSSNSSLPTDDIVSIMLVENKSVNSGLKIFPNDIFVADETSVGLFDYVIPHVYASSKYAGTTGWNFVNYTPTTEALPTDEAALPKADKYTWDYPSWRNYQNYDLQYKHPGLDPRNLFLEANLKAIADGRAGTQNYWNLGEIPNFDSIQLAQSLQDSSWVNGVTGGVTKNTSSTYLDGKYVVGGYTTLDTAYFGLKNNLEPLVLTNPNPTLSSIPRSGQKVGYISYYNENGQIQDVITIRGEETEVWDVQASQNQKSLYVLGSYKGYIEAGDLIWSSVYPGAAGMTGPTGGPIGFSNVQTPGITGSPYLYPWIYNGTQTLPATGPFLPVTTIAVDNVAVPGIFVMEIEKNLGNQTSYGGVNFGATGSLETSYRLKNFRSFPGASSIYDPLSSSSTIDTAFYEKTLSLAISDYDVDIVGTLEGGIATYKNEYGRTLDNLETSEFLFSSWNSSSYLKDGFWISLGTELELIKTNATYGTGGNKVFNSVQKDQGTLTYLITGTSDCPSFDFLGTSVTGGTSGVLPFYLISNNTPSVSSYNFIQTNSAPIDADQGIDSGYRNGKYFFGTTYSGTASFGSYTASQEANYDGYSLLTVEITPSQSFTTLFSNKILPVDLNSTAIGIDDIEMGKEGQIFYSVFSQGGTATNNIYKINQYGGLNGSILVGGTGHMRLALDDKDNLLIGGYRIGLTGPDSLPIVFSTSDTSFASLIPQYIPGVGIDLGNIISRAGSGAWTWADVHDSYGDLPVPLLSTVFFTNYASNIFGKQNNQWILKDEVSGTVILDVKSIPYFIYTFTESGYYSIENKVEDSLGNVYQISKPAFIKVFNQSVPSESDPNPEFVNSVDYGYPPVMPGDKINSVQLSKDLLDQQAVILGGMRQPFGSGLVLKNDPDATFSGN
jgi:hypothetical protein